MKISDSQALERALQKFWGHADVIPMEELLILAGKRFGFSASESEAELYFSCKADFELVQLSDPETGGIAWYLWDQRRNNAALQKDDLSVTGLPHINSSHSSIGVTTETTK